LTYSLSTGSRSISLSVITFSKNKEGERMAKPINEAPILRGKEAEHFFATFGRTKARRFQKLRSAGASILRTINQKFLPGPLQAM
jgi:hypothetical protein